jgi:hypothetical protein
MINWIVGKNINRSATSIALFFLVGRAAISAFPAVRRFAQEEVCPDAIPHIRL